MSVWFLPSRMQLGADRYYRPNVGGVVGLADLYVDPALGFSLGWAAWVSLAGTLFVMMFAHVENSLV